VVALAIAVVLYGLYVLTRAKFEVFPEFSPTQVVIQTEAPGLSAELVETLVSQSIENAVAGVVGLQLLRSQSIPGLSVVTIVFDEGSDIYRNRQLTAERLATIAGKLPAGVVPKVTPLTSSASTVLGVGITSTTRSLVELRTVADTLIKPHLLQASGVADVNVFGGKLRQWQIQAKPEQLLRFGLSLNDLSEAARRASAVAGTGYIENQNQRIIVNVDAQALDPRSLEQVVVAAAAEGARPITLGEVARVVEAPAPSISAAAINSVPGVFFMVQGQLGTDTRVATQRLQRALDEIETVLKQQGIELHRDLFRPADFIDTAVNNVRRDLLIGSALVVGILFVFLFNLRTAMISAAAIPVSLIAAVIILDAFGMSLNIMVLGGLAIALGEVVDDAIIDTENIFRRLRENRLLTQPRPAQHVVFDASLEVRSSVVYATFIVALVFVPLLTLGGIAGKLFSPLGLAYILAILASLVVALTLTPALAYLLLTRKDLHAKDPPLIAWLQPGYRRALAWVERHPVAIIFSVGLVLAAGVGMLPLFGGEFIPPLKEGHYIVHMTTVPGTSEQESLRIGQRVAQRIGAIRGVRSVVQWVGRAESGADTFGTHYSEFEVEIGQLPGADQRRIYREMRAALGELGQAKPAAAPVGSATQGGSQQDGDKDDDDEHPAARDGAQAGGAGFMGANFAVNTFLTDRIGETIAGYAAPVVVNVFGSDLDLLDRDVRQVAGLLSEVRGAQDVQLLAPPGAPQLNIRLRHDKLAMLGLAPLDVLDAVRTVYDGMPVGQVYLANQVVDVVVTLDPAKRIDIMRAGAVPLRARGGKLSTLAEVADIAQVNGRYKVLHEGGKRLQTVTAGVRNRDVESFVAEFLRRAGTLRLSPGNYISVTGAAEAQRQAREDLIVHSALAAVGIFLLLYIAFNNLRNLVITFVNLPFALVGGVAAVLAAGGWVSLGSLVGFVTLFGITLRNSIMLVAHYQHLVQNEGASWDAATAQRGAQERLPSILMTALVTALGLLPLALGSGEPGREIEGPMASIIVGGLVTSTLLNLLVLPTLLLHFGRFNKQRFVP
jgi:Cu/Ag efflux pump CusA